MSTGLILTQEQQQVAEQKQATWSKFGLNIYTTELQLQSMASTAKSNLSVLPTTIFEVPEAEQRLAEGKRNQKAIEDARKLITSKFDDLAKRLMENEKSLSDPIAQLSAEIIKIKKEDEAKQKKIKATNDELVRCKEFFQNEAISSDSFLKNKVLDLVSRCYNKALESNISPSEIKAYIETSKSAVKGDHFIATIPNFNAAYITTQQVADIAKEYFKLNMLDYVDSFKSQLDEKFSDYDVAYANKSDALALAQKQEAEAKAAIRQQAQQQQVANKIEAAAVTSTPTQFYTKALKKSYAIDMDETMENALAIIAAFSANLHLCMKHVKVSKWFGFSATQAGNALAKVKCDDNEFNPIGINFKEVEKL